MELLSLFQSIQAILSQALTQFAIASFQPMAMGFQAATTLRFQVEKRRNPFLHPQPIRGMVSGIYT
jgi:hypothetical protein